MRVVKSLLNMTMLDSPKYRYEESTIDETTFLIYFAHWARIGL